MITLLDPSQLSRTKAATGLVELVRALPPAEVTRPVLRALIQAEHIGFQNGRRFEAQSPLGKIRLSSSVSA